MLRNNSPTASVLQPNLVSYRTYATGTTDSAATPRREPNNQTIDIRREALVGELNNLATIHA
ncbi:hypothetical protein [Nostoc sp.]|uniref:hypothetical protein n=1 Tax=Nostoc sp. TaxID=1180 RepID=UPI002FFB8BC4